MKIFGNCLVKNEADVIEETLTKAARWCDRIFVFDNGSTDGTWEIVQSLSKREPRIVPYKHSAVPFSNGLRSEIFNAFRAEATDGDWWCLLDADEIYIDDPKTFLAPIPRREHVVWAVSFQHYFTEIDDKRCLASPDSYPPNTPVEEAIQYHLCNYSEVRFFRHRHGLVWSNTSLPRHVGIVHRRRIRLKHYQYRSPSQIQLRLSTRQEAIRQGCENFADYSSETDWRLKIVQSSTCLHATDANAYAITENSIPWHMETPLKRIVKTFMHQTHLWP